MDKSAVKVDKAKEGLQGLLGGGHLPLFDSGNLLGVGANLSISYNETKVFNLGFFEEALLWFQTEVVIT